MHIIRLSDYDRTDADMPYTVADAKVYLNVLHSSHDDLIADLIQSAMDMIEARTSIVLREAVGTADARSWTACIQMDKNPIRSITSIQYYDEDDTLQTVDSDDYDLRGTGQYPTIYFDPEYDFPTLSANKVYPITITMTMGYTVDNVPRRAKQYLRYIVNDMYNNRDNPPRERMTAAERYLMTLGPLVVA